MQIGPALKIDDLSIFSGAAGNQSDNTLLIRHAVFSLKPEKVKYSYIELASRGMI